MYSQLSIERRPGKDGNPTGPDQIHRHGEWCIEAYETHGQVRIKGHKADHFHYITTVIARKPYL